VLYRVFGHWEKSYLNTRKKYNIFTCENIICCKTHCTDVLLFFTEFCLYIINRKIHGCLEIPDLFLVLNMISHSFITRNKSSISAHPCIYYSLFIMSTSRMAHCLLRYYTFGSSSLNTTVPGKLRDVAVSSKR
jgi:hypothetical protein